VAVEEVKKLSKPVSGKMIAQVGSISANSDTTVGNIIAEAMKKVGKDGVITVEESKTMTTELQTVDESQNSESRTRSTSAFSICLARCGPGSCAAPRRHFCWRGHCVSSWVVTKWSGTTMVSWLGWIM
jgi:hypothetical protein